MEQPIRLTLRASPDEMMDFANQVGESAARGSWLRWRGVIAGAAGPVAAAVLAAVLGADPKEAAAIGAIASGVSLLVLNHVHVLAGRRFRRELRGSIFRTQPTEVVLSAEGLRVEAATYAWSGIPEVRRDGTTTFLMFTPVDAYIIRDADLPDGLSPEAMVARIAAWSSGP